MTADVFYAAYDAAMQGYSEPAHIIVHPAHWRQVKIVIRFHEIFAMRVRSDWREFKPKFPAKRHTRWVQRLYVRHVRSESMAQAKREIEAEEAAGQMI